ncbi:MAG: hypothetical protein COV73_01240 [Candidatus Omnitrophica bacterium CG11_big_fil_rev_8_21_14_0_20_43_6]|nr:MAG: hypothetical protein COV73_01240 [Candidatus Omnitrophica bacterium CG11_big_fil_rev_8_21_14_0_20_43_6]
MKKIIVLLCLGLIGCSTATKDSKFSPRTPKGEITYSEKEMDDIINVFSGAIEKSPDYGGGYYNRAVAYFYYQNNYDKCWQDVHKAESLGYKFSDEFLSALRKASNRKE